MARKEAVFEPNDPGLISPMTEGGDDQVLISPNYDPKDDDAAEIDPDYGGIAQMDGAGPTPADGYNQVIPDFGPPTDMLSPKGEPGDLSASGGSAAGLPDDLGFGDDPALSDLTDPGADLGSTLLDDLTDGVSDRPEPTDGLDGMNDGWSAPVLDDPTGSDAMDDGDSDENDRILQATSAEEFHEASETMTDLAIEAYEEGDDVWGDFLAEAAMAAEEARQERVDLEELQSGDDPPSEETMPAPDDGTGGEPDADDFIGGRGDVDPAPETEPAGDGGDLDTVAAGLGAVDPDPDAEEAGTAGRIDTVSLGQGVIDPLEDESTLLGNDTGDLAEMATEADLGDIEDEFDDSLVDADIGEDV